jgi:hypothetical protein
VTSAQAPHQTDPALGQNGGSGGWEPRRGCNEANATLERRRRACRGSNRQHDRITRQPWRPKFEATETGQSAASRNQRLIVWPVPPTRGIRGAKGGPEAAADPKRTSELPLTLASADRGKGAQKEQAAINFPGAQKLEQNTAVAARLAARVSFY